MISSIGAVGSVNSSYSVYGAQQVLSPQTKLQLQSLGIDTTNIKTEAQGQTALQSSQNSQTQGTQQAPPSGGGGNSAMESIKEEAVSLAQRVGVSVSSNDKIDDILDAIAGALSQLQAQAVNDPQKAAQIAQFQTEYQSLCQSVSDAQSSQQNSSVQSASNQIQSGMNGLASYNIASISISNSGKLKT